MSSQPVANFLHHGEVSLSVREKVKREHAGNTKDKPKSPYAPTQEMGRLAHVSFFTASFNNSQQWAAGVSEEYTGEGVFKDRIASTGHACRIISAIRNIPTDRHTRVRKAGRRVCLHSTLTEIPKSAYRDYSPTYVITMHADPGLPSYTCAENAQEPAHRHAHAADRYLSLSTLLSLATCKACWPWQETARQGRDSPLREAVGRNHLVHGSLRDQHVEQRGTRRGRAADVPGCT